MQVVVLDPGVLLNAMAGQFLHQLSPQLRFAIPQPPVREQILWSEEPPIDGSGIPLGQSGVIEVVVLGSNTELQLLIEYAAVAEENEAAAAALAQSRDWVLATDEIKLEREFLRKSGGRGRTVSTLRLLKEWSAAATAHQIGEAIQRLQRFASFSPPRSASNYEWWLSQCELAGLPQLSGER